MEELIKPLLDNQYFKVISALVTFASALAALIPTPSPDTFLGKLYRIIDILAINVGKAKQTGLEKP